MAKIRLVPGQLYFLREKDYLNSEISDYVKIGLVRNEKETETRMKEHQTGNPRQILEIESLESPMVENLETQMHHRFSEQWVTGEWFKMTDDEVKQAIAKAESIIGEQQSVEDTISESYDLGDVKSNGRIVDPTDDYREAWQALVDLKYDLEVVRTRQKIVERQLRAAMGTFAGIEGVVDFIEKTIADSFDKKKFIEEEPDIAAEYTSEEEKPVSGSFLLKNVRKLKDDDPNLKKELDANPENKPAFSEVQLGTELPITPDLTSLHANFLEFEDTIATLGWECDMAEAKLKCMLGVNETIEGLCAWKRQSKTTEKFDTTQFKEDHPDLYGQYIKPETSTYAVSVRPYRAYPF